MINSHIYVIWANYRFTVWLSLTLLCSIFCQRNNPSWPTETLTLNSYFGPWVYSPGSLVITLVVRLSVCPSVRVSVCLWISQIPLISFFLKFYMKLGIIKVKKVTRPGFWKKMLIRGLRGIIWHFLGDNSLKVSNFLHDCRGQ